MKMILNKLKFTKQLKRPQKGVETFVSTPFYIECISRNKPDVCFKNHIHLIFNEVIHGRFEDDPIIFISNESQGCFET